MPYSINTIERVKRERKGSLGNTLGRLAVDLDFSVMKIAKATGATRQTIYNWFFGGEVLTPYRASVERLIEVLRKASTAEKAWVQICQDFNLNP